MNGVTGVPDESRILDQIPLTPRRMQCGLLAFKVLKTMVYSLDATVHPEER